MVMIICGIGRGDTVWLWRMVKVVSCLRQT
jgi:hypothetical protein